MRTPERSIWYLSQQISVSQATPTVSKGHKKCFHKSFFYSSWRNCSHNTKIKWLLCPLRTAVVERSLFCHENAHKTHYMVLEVRECLYLIAGFGFLCALHKYGGSCLFLSQNLDEKVVIICDETTRFWLDWNHWIQELEESISSLSHVKIELYVTTYDEVMHRVTSFEKIEPSIKSSKKSPVQFRCKNLLLTRLHCLSYMRHLP